MRQLLDVEPKSTISAPRLGSPSPSTSSKIAGITSAAAASNSIRDCTLAAVAIELLRSRPMPPTSIAAPSTSRMLPRIEPTIERLDDLLQALVEREQGDDQLRRVAEGDVQQAADPGPGLRRELLGGEPHQRRRGDDPERRDDEDQPRRGVGELEHDRERDERRQQVRPALRREQERRGPSPALTPPPPRAPLEMRAGAGSSSRKGPGERRGPSPNSLSREPLELVEAGLSGLLGVVPGR